MLCSLYDEPITILNKITAGTSEMGKQDLSFLCGLIKEKAPKKIVEIGVASGGTTAVILNCLSLLNSKAILYSIDINENLYFDKSKKTGFMVEQAVNFLRSPVEHNLYTGGYVVEFLQTIGKDIDFLILDTAHVLPGELLDFLACFPFLKENATVVVHDVLLHHLENNSEAYATRVLVNSVAAERIEVNNTTEFIEYLNLGAFTITKDTEKYIGNVFESLLLTWKYIPVEREIQLYRDFYTNYYSKKFVNIFDKAVELNKATLDKRHDYKITEFIEVFKMVEECKKYKTYVYGCGQFGKAFHNILCNCGVKVEGYIISDDVDKTDLDLQIFHLSELQIDEESDIVLIGVNLSLQEEIEEVLSNKGIKHYLVPDKIICDFIGK